MTRVARVCAVRPDSAPRPMRTRNTLSLETTQAQAVQTQSPLDELRSGKSTPAPRTRLATSK